MHQVRSRLQARRTWHILKTTQVERRGQAGSGLNWKMASKSRLLENACQTAELRSPVVEICHLVFLVWEDLPCFLLSTRCRP